MPNAGLRQVTHMQQMAAQGARMREAPKLLTGGADGIQCCRPSAYLRLAADLMTDLDTSVADAWHWSCAVSRLLNMQQLCMP